MAPGAAPIRTLEDRRRDSAGDAFPLESGKRRAGQIASVVDIAEEAMRALQRALQNLRHAGKQRVAVRGQKRLVDSGGDFQGLLIAAQFVLPRNALRNIADRRDMRRASFVKEMAGADFHRENDAVFFAMIANRNLNDAAAERGGAGLVRLGRQVGVFALQQFGAAIAIQRFRRMVDVQDIARFVVDDKDRFRFELEQVPVFCFAILQRRAQAPALEAGGKAQSG
ncbi:MAG: hypothetical protein BWZ10_01162 [candidate division BRC1 bacterium ADurb.BinA364]|nr:MAG: hypothetical protein BWZ10_01162 [candidate division BRC1 bacterium ADurb.BinA364]